MIILIASSSTREGEHLRNLIQVSGTYPGSLEIIHDENVPPLNDHHADIIFIDAGLPNCGGIELAKQLLSDNPKSAIIFTASDSECAQSALDIGAIDCLKKPYSPERLQQALLRANIYVQDGHAESKCESRQEPRTCIRVHGNRVTKLIPLLDVTYFQSESKYVLVRHNCGEDLIRESLDQLEAEFGSSFTRIHRNALVANSSIKALKRLRSGQHQLQLEGCEKQLQVSRRHLPIVRQIIDQLG